MDRTLEAAEFLAGLRARKEMVDDLDPDLKPADLAQAYAVQAALVEKLTAARGCRVKGYKVACTNPLAQAQLHVPGPVFGRLLSDLIFDSPAALPAENYTRLIIEPEFGFLMAEGAPAQDGPYTPDSISERIEALLPAIEIVDHRFKDWSLVGGIGLAADNAYNGGWVKGEPYPGDWRELDLAAQEVTLTSSRGQTLHGSGAAVLGHPLNVMAWLANELNSQGLQLEKGQLVTTGVTTDILVLEAGQSARAEFGPVGGVEVSFT